MRKVLHAGSARWENLSYRKSGDHSGMAVMFIHGAVGDSRLYRYQLRHFGARYKTIAVDLPGHGHSYTGVRPSLDDFIGAIEDILKEESVSSFILVGHSMGGGVCLEAYRRGIGGLAGMVLVSTSPVLPIAPALVDILERDDMDALADLIVGAVFSRKVDILTGFARKGLAEMDRGVIRGDVDICREMDFTGMLNEIDLPVLVVANRGDLVIPYDSTAAISEKIRNARLVAFDDDGHVPFFENPRNFNESVDEFLSTIEPKSYP
ncbi:MAG: alpha/beta hydrolase [Spirochaetes bacterium]|nr:alpha/beta hydrolase [Spirochaetota bacterium]